MTVTKVSVQDQQSSESAYSDPKTQPNTHPTHPFNGPLSGTTQVSRCQKGKNQSGFY